MILQRIKQYIDSKGIAVSVFEKSIGMSNASFGKSLKSGGTIGADKLEIILNIYPDINIEWLILGRGDMIKSDYDNNKGNEVYKSLFEKKDNEVKELNREIGRLLSIIDQIKAYDDSDNKRELKCVAEPDIKYPKKK